MRRPVYPIRTRLANLQQILRGLYQDLTEEPVPEFLAVFIRELEDREQRANR